jgi:hypothetical protein
MYKKSKNPQVEELTKTYTERVFPISDLDFIIRDDGTKGCIWCGDPLKSKHHSARYCKDKMCPTYAFAWGQPQKEAGLFFLLVKQDFRCAICNHDYKPFIARSINKALDYKNDYNFYMIKELKQKIDKKLLPEVDHIVPISKGGTSLGLDNHQVICYTCHKAKTKNDNAGPRVKDPIKEYKRQLKKEYERIIWDFKVWANTSYKAEYGAALDYYFLHVAPVNDLDKYIEYYNTVYSVKSHVEHKTRLIEIRNTKAANKL